MPRFLSILLLTTLSSLLFSCSKHQDDEEETPENIPMATITFSSPTPDAVYTNGDSVTIQAKAISTASIHGYDLAIRKAGEPTSNIYFIHIHDHNDTLNIIQKWKSEVSTPASLEAEISLYIDHNGHTKKEKVGFRVQ